MILNLKDAPAEFAISNKAAWVSDMAVVILNDPLCEIAVYDRACHYACSYHVAAVSIAQDEWELRFG